MLLVYKFNAKLGSYASQVAKKDLTKPFLYMFGLGTAIGSCASIKMISNTSLNIDDEFYYNFGIQDNDRGIFMFPRMKPRGSC